MKNLKTPKILALIIATLMLSSVILMISQVQAQEHGGQPSNAPGGSILLPTGVTPDVSYETIVYLSYKPAPLGVGHPLLINVWLEPPVHVARYFSYAFKVTLTKPDGTTDSVYLTSYYGDTTAYYK